MCLIGTQTMSLFYTFFLLFLQERKSIVFLKTNKREKWDGISEENYYHRTTDFAFVVIKLKYLQT